MPKTRKLEQCEPVDERQPDQSQRDARHVRIGNHVLSALGKPADLLQIQVRPLWDERYRVNIVVGPHFASARVANSFFLKADEDGNVITSTPPIKKLYVRVAENASPVGSVPD
ncbi:MAG TPA: hypothetical protein VH120_12790 [Gemmataceae bacterium]|nr:hypothetical protein [Gemmataceae bacterium]